MEFLSESLKALDAYKQFVVYQLVKSQTRVGKFDKIPIDPYTQKKLKWGNRDNLMHSKDAIAWSNYLGKDFGAGFVFTDDDPFFFIDIDNCVENNDWSDLAKNILQTFSGAAMEVSTSGKGLHIIGSGRVADFESQKNELLNLEFYTSNRFVALTGFNAVGDATAVCDNQLVWFKDNFFNNKKIKIDSNFWSDTPVPEWSGTDDDTILISRMLKSKSAASVFGDNVKFSDLWECNLDALIQKYPSENNNSSYNQSRADASLAQHLAFWTGNNCERILRLMKQSKLVREKWDRDEYMRSTIRFACANQKTWICDKPPQVLQNENKKSKIVSGSTFLSIDAQLTLFEGCTYISDIDRILVPGGNLLNVNRFRVMYGGFSFPMDLENGRVTRSAWEAFTESQAIRHNRVHSSTFRPDLPYGEIIDKDGQTLVNAYWPINTKRIKGDPTLFLKHVDKIFEDPRDGAIMISYMASLIRNLGVKFQWCPLLQGAQGNGKTFFTRAVAFGVGDRYTHFPKSKEMDGKFNNWMYGKCFIGVEDIYDGKRELMENLKPMITGNRLEIEPKGTDKVTQDICANFILNTNHKDGLRKHRDDRRFSPFFTRQQRFEDFKRDGMTGDYFHKLYNWAIKENGFAIICDYLDNFDIPDEFNPATECQRAPVTSSTELAITESRTSVQQEIIEAIEQGVLGFKGGWVSSMMLDALLIRIKANGRVSHNKRRDLMRELGYDWHPGLKDGRVNNTVLPDGGKPRLFVQENHAMWGSRAPADIARAYTESQNS